MIAAHIQEKGVTRAADFGVDQPAVDALRSMGIEVFRTINQQRPWQVNTMAMTTQKMWGYVNAELIRRDKPTIRRDEK